MNKILNNKLKVAVALIIATVSIFSTVSVDAQTILETVNPTVIDATKETKAANGSLIPDKINDNTSSFQGSGTLSKAEDYMNDKLGDVVGFLQSFIKPAAYVGFIFSAITILVGVVAGSKHKFAGLLGMVFSILVYVCVSFGPEIVEYFAAWLSM